ncbi:hypothetical protein GCM10010503_04700 [Streptomyces lucensis JCM 4490]|uniref:Uncharacterized protein n=1 Tax=Streptomyces lucensis JCM 4490 TaxID=1306176 RepID=A0A918MKX7_9ACTN|nr:hypothetical protein [Streptomyces lucensis]GGW32024.1 hypothetical protein GCM10010503_04700 [Streptomyces lucensis JCM 4490]
MMGNAISGVPRWAVRAAYAVPLLTLPSGLWRIALAAGLPVASEPVRTGWGVAYVLVLTAVTEGLALLTLGLVQPWGEVVPRWIPLVGGRAVRPLAVVAAALAGACLLSALSLLVGFVQGGNLADGALTDTRAQSVLLVVCYTPLLAWAPLLTVSAIAYYRRRTAPTPVQDGVLEGR